MPRNKRRLRRLADFVETLPNGKKFHMGSWAVSRNEEHARKMIGEDDDVLEAAEVWRGDELDKLKLKQNEKAFYLSPNEVRKIGLQEKGEPSCNTAMCLAGWACFLWPKEVNPDEDFEDNAERILGLEWQVARELFYNFSLTPKKAAKKLRALADGEEG